MPGTGGGKVPNYGFTRCMPNGNFHLASVSEPLGTPRSLFLVLRPSVLCICAEKGFHGGGNPCFGLVERDGAVSQAGLIVCRMENRKFGVSARVNSRGEGD